MRDDEATHYALGRRRCHPKQVFAGSFRCKDRIELILGISESALRAPSSVSTATQNEKVLANSHGKKVHDIVGFSSLQFEAKLKLS